MIREQNVRQIYEFHQDIKCVIFLSIPGGSMVRILFAVYLLCTGSFSYANLPNQITVGSYNLHGMENPKGLKKDLAALSHVQIWAFQEVNGDFSDRTKQNILNILPSGQWYIISQKVNLIDSKKGIWEGQVIASRFPPDSIASHPLKHTSQKNRVALIANFKMSSEETFTFTNTDHEVQVLSINFEDRKKQLLSLVDYFSQNNSKGIITGDFNTTGGDDEIEKTENILSRVDYLRVEPFDKDSYTFEKMFIRTELDHFFYRNVTTSPRYRYNARTGSDHYPIYMVVGL